MIDLNDEKQKYFYLGKCVSGKDIDFYGFKIKQPTVDEIFDMGEDSFYKILTPFILGRNLYQAPDDMSLFECIMNNKEVCMSLFLAINYFMKVDFEDMKIYESVSMSKKLGRKVNQLIVNGKLIIDSDKFEELKTIVLMISNTKEVNKNDVAEEDNFKGLSEETRKMKEKLLKGRKKKNISSDEKKVKLVNVYNYVVHCQEVIDYEKSLKWTIYQLYNTYQNEHIKENTKFLFDVASNGMLDKNSKLEQFSEKIVK